MGTLLCRQITRVHPIVSFTLVLIIVAVLFLAAINTVPAYHKEDIWLSGMHLEFFVQTVV